MDKTDRKYSNGEITVFWQPKKCIHATTCYRELIDVFNPRKRPWVNMDGASTQEIIRVVKLCPTQALSYKFNSELEEEKKAAEPAEVTSEARIMEDGPLVLKGNFVLYDTDGKELRHLRMSSLCRCGASNNLPYCDGTHRKIGYTGK
jgi:uncharacterized Fe-S cluster protein YjdI/CDGSH-type Zn-finger protein